MTAPCKDCQNRALGCHETCKDYAAYKKERDTENTKRHIEIASLDYTITMCRRRKWKR